MVLVFILLTTPIAIGHGDRPLTGEGEKHAGTRKRISAVVVWELEASQMTEQRTFRSTDRVFTRIFREVTKLQHIQNTPTAAELQAALDGAPTENTTTTRTTVALVTEIYFSEGWAIIDCTAAIWKNVGTYEGSEPEDFFPGGDDDPTGTILRRHMVHSAAIRIGIAAHDRMIDDARARLPESTERTS